ncbi:MAG: AarF/UbiB family protein, partial [Patescibacteria group bacterium]
AQGLNVPKVLTSKMSATEQAEQVAQIAKGMQEGIMPPDSKQRQDIADALPDGLSYNGLISSASIAHVVETETPKGKKRATKVKRPNISEAIVDNEDTFNLVAKVYTRFIEKHIEGTSLGEKRQRIKEVLPFVLKTFSDDLRRELHFPSEIESQNRGYKIFKSHKGIHVPEIDDEYTDDEHITMEYLDGIRLEDLPAHADHLKNLFVVVLESWKSRFLHGDMHGGNVKGRGDGTLVVYDWGKSVELTPDFVKNMGKFLFAIVRKNPDAIAQTYVKIQSPNSSQISIDEARLIAQEVLSSIPEDTTMRKAFVDTTKDVAISMGIHHQSILDTNYATALQTAVRYGSVISQELAKPEYQDKKFRRKALRQGVTGAIKEVYLSKKTKKKTT